MFVFKVYKTRNKTLYFSYFPYIMLFGLLQLGLVWCTLVCSSYCCWVGRGTLGYGWI